MTITDPQEKNLLKSLKNEAPTTYEKVYVKLHKGDPTESGEAEAAAETKRKETKLTGENPLKNESEMKWEEVAAEEEYKYVSLWSAAVEGTCLWSGPMKENKKVGVGDNFVIKKEVLEVALT